MREERSPEIRKRERQRRGPDLDLHGIARVETEDEIVDVDRRSAKPFHSLARVLVFIELDSQFAAHVTLAQAEQLYVVLHAIPLLARCVRRKKSAPVRPALRCVIDRLKERDVLDKRLRD